MTADDIIVGFSTASRTVSTVAFSNTLTRSGLPRERSRLIDRAWVLNHGAIPILRLIERKRTFVQNVAAPHRITHTHDPFRSRHEHEPNKIDTSVHSPDRLFHRPNPVNL